MTIFSSVVIYKNTPQQIHTVLKALAGSSPDIQVLVIDNSPEPLRLDPGILSRIQYIKTPNNIGFGAAHNLAMKKSLEQRAKYHLVLNPDVYFNRKVIQELYNYMEANPDVGNVMPMVCYPDGRNQCLAKLMPRPGWLLVRLFHPLLPSSLVQKVNRAYELHDLDLDRPVQAPSLSGCFMFLRCDALRRAGLFDERFFLYFEDFDLIRRISLYYKIIYYPELSISHDFERASRKNWSAFLTHVSSAVKYFNKWGWYEDEQRETLNEQTISLISNSKSEKSLKTPVAPKKAQF